MSRYVAKFVDGFAAALQNIFRRENRKIFIIHDVLKWRFSPAIASKQVPVRSYRSDVAATSPLINTFRFDCGERSPDAKQDPFVITVFHKVFRYCRGFSILTGRLLSHSRAGTFFFFFRNAPWISNWTKLLVYVRHRYRPGKSVARYLQNRIRAG